MPPILGFRQSLTGDANELRFYALAKDIAAPFMPTPVNKLL